MASIDLITLLRSGAVQCFKAVLAKSSELVPTLTSSIYTDSRVQYRNLLLSSFKPSLLYSHRHG